MQTDRKTIDGQKSPGNFSKEFTSIVDCEHTDMQEKTFNYVMKICVFIIQEK